MNALWGKLAQNENNTVVAFLNDYDELLSLVNDSSKEVTSLDFISCDVIRCTYKKTITSCAQLNNRNVVIASFVTAYGRLELFKIIDKLQKRVLYFDTDSVIYVCDESNYNDIETGMYLGQLTNEMKGGDKEWIESFCSTGPKCYAYKTNLGANEICVKGFSLSGDACEQLHFASISNCVFDKTNSLKITYQNKITRDKQQLITEQSEEKTFRFTFDKRVVRDDYSTVPYGFIG